MHIQLGKEEHVVLEVTKAIERSCIADNTEFFMSLDAEQREAFVVKLGQNSAHKIQLCLNIINNIPLKKIRRKGEDISRAFEELNFSEHLFVWKVFAELLSEWDDAISNQEFESSVQVLSIWRSKRMAHTRDSEIFETSFDDYLSAASFMARVIDLELEFEDGLNVPKVRTNMPIPEYEKDGGRFVGRSKDRRDLKRLIAKNHVTCIAGRGGLGKTALAQCLVREYQMSDEFDCIVWFSCKTDRMSPSGIRKLGKYDSSYNRLLLNCIRVYEGEEISYEDDGDREFLLKYLEDLVEPSDNLLIVLDNYETLNVVGEEDYALFQQYLSDVEDLPFSKNAKWLVTSRNTLSYAATKTLDRLDDDSADKLFLQSIEKTDNFPAAIFKKTRKKEYRRGLLKKLHNYPLYIKMFCGWLGLGRTINESLREGANVEELEEFCFRNTISLLNDGLNTQVRRYLFFVLETTEQNVTDLLPVDYCNSLMISLDELSDYNSKLTMLSVIINSGEGGVEVAPAMAMYIKRHLRKDDVAISAIENQVASLKRDRQIKVDQVCHEYRSEIREEYKEAISVWNSIKNATEADRDQISLRVGKSRFRNQLALFYSLKSAIIESGEIHERLAKIEGEASDGYAYWSFVRVIWQKSLRIADYDKMLEFGIAMKRSFPNLIEPALNLLTQRVFVRIQQERQHSGIQELLEELKNLRVNARTGEEKKMWKVAVTRVLKSLSDSQIQLDGPEKEVLSSILEELILTSPIHKNDLDWTSRVSNYCFQINEDRWSQWIDKGAMYWFDFEDYDAYNRWNSLMLK